MLLSSDYLLYIDWYVLIYLVEPIMDALRRSLYLFHKILYSDGYQKWLVPTIEMKGLEPTHSVLLTKAENRDKI